MMQVIHPNAGGIDIGASDLYVAVPEGRAEKTIRRFGTYTDDLHSLGQWLVECGVDTVAMESTGVYWVSVYLILEAYGIKVQLVNAKHVKNVPGRKSDVKDCVWLRDLHSLGLLRGSFIPEEEIVALRSYQRHREALIEQRSVHVNHMHKALVQMNVRLDEVLSDLTGVTGLAIIRAIAAGERDTNKLLKYRNKQCRSTPEQFVKALTANYRDEHVFTLNQSLALYDMYSEQVAKCDKQIEAHMQQMKPKDPTPPETPLGPSRKTNTHSKNEPTFDARAQLYRLTGGVDLTEIDGLHVSTVQTIISEIGVDMSRWPTAAHFASWLGLSPKNDITGGKVKKSRTLPGNSRASQAFRMGAQSLMRSNSALGAYARRMKARKDAPKAIVATAHKLARIVYNMLKNKTSFQAASAADYDKANLERERKAIERRAMRLGLKVVPAT
jgi:transposase